MNRIFTLIAMCVFTIGAAFAEETTIDFASLYGDAKVQPATPVTSGSFSFSFEKGNSATEPSYFVNTSVKEMRLYGGLKASPLDGNVMTVTSTAAMTKMVFEGGSNATDKVVDVKASEGTIEYDSKTRVLTWTGNASTVKFTVYCNATQSGQ